MNTLQCVAEEMQVMQEQIERLTAERDALKSALEFVDDYLREIDSMNPDKDHGVRGRQVRHSIRIALG